MNTRPLVGAVAIAGAVLLLAGCATTSSSDAPSSPAYSSPSSTSPPAPSTTVTVTVTPTTPAAVAPPTTQEQTEQTEQTEQPTQEQTPVAQCNNGAVINDGGGNYTTCENGQWVAVRPTFDPNSGDGYGPNQPLPPLCVRFPDQYTC